MAAKDIKPVSYWEQHPVIKTYRRLLSFSAVAKKHKMSRQRVREIVLLAEKAGAHVPVLKYRRGIPQKRVHVRKAHTPKPPKVKIPKEPPFALGGLEGVGDRVYLLHAIDKDGKVAGHYVGWSNNVIRRIAAHRRGSNIGSHPGAKMVDSWNRAGYIWYVVRIWEAPVQFEKKLHRLRGNQNLCPCCPHRSKHYYAPRSDGNKRWKRKLEVWVPKGLMEVARQFPYCNGFKTEEKEQE